MYLQNAKDISSDAQGVKDAQYILSTPDFTGDLICPIRHQTLAVLDPATQKHIHSNIYSNCKNHRYAKLSH